MTAFVVIPTLNERDHIEDLLAHFLAEPAEIVGAILVADGGSTDGTRAIVERVVRQQPRVQLIDNPDRIQSAGINRAVALADPRWDVMVRVDAHAAYPRRYVARLLAALEQHKADTVVVRLITKGVSVFQCAVAAAQNSRIGTGGAAHRMGKRSGFVDHGHHAAFRRRVFEQAGGYDTSFEANEDAELDARIRQQGGRIWLDTTIPVIYYPRKSLLALARQYFRYGSGRARTALKHREPLKARQMLPPLVVLAIAASVLGTFVWPPFMGIALGYAALLLGVASIMALQRRSVSTLLAAPAAAAMHLAWGAGFLRRIVTQRGSVMQLVAPRAVLDPWSVRNHKERE